MAASRKENPALIALAKESDVPVPWCKEYRKMISGMESVHLLLLSISESMLTRELMFHSFSTEAAPELRAFKLEVMRKLLEFNDGSIPDD